MGTRRPVTQARTSEDSRDGLPLPLVQVLHRVHGRPAKRVKHASEPGQVLDAKEAVIVTRNLSTRTVAVTGVAHLAALD